MIDYVDRAALIKAMAKECGDMADVTFDICVDVAKNFPAFNRDARWVSDGEDEYCSACKVYAEKLADGRNLLSLYCPYCGARMERF